jgi:CheY-like chemotaxis protein
VPEITKEEREDSQRVFESPALQAVTPSEGHAAKPHVVFLDDSPLARWVWEAKLKPLTNIRCFAGPRELFERIESGSIELSKIHTMITDHYFAPDERLTGLDVARELRSRGFGGRILLASNGAFSAAELTGLVDKVVDKSPVDWDELGH